MQSLNHISYQTGIPEEYRSAAVELYDEAFGNKLSVAIKNHDARKQIFLEGVLLNYAIGALSEEGLLGMAGFQTAEGSFTGGIRYRDLISQLGWIKGNRAALILVLYERTPEPGELVMDGIAVHSEARGKGIGSALLEEIRSYAKQHGYTRVRLDVIDTNPKAKKLYERVGFVAVKTERFPYLKGLLGFGGVTTMMLMVDEES